MEVKKVVFVEDGVVIAEYSTIEEILSVFNEKTSIYISDFYRINDVEYEIEEISFSIENRSDFEISVHLKKLIFK